MVLDTSLKILLNKHINLVCLMKKITTNIRDRVEASFNHSKMESISNNGEVKLKMIQVRMETSQKNKQIKTNG